MRIAALIVMLMGIGRCFAEGACFRTPAQAAVQVGEQEGGGYRLEFVTADAFGRRNWASVRSCAHPEWPAVLVAAEIGGVPHIAGISDDKAARIGQMDVLAGRRVTVVMNDGMVRLQMTGVTQAGGRIGDTVRVRILAPGDKGDGRFVEAVVRGSDVLEMVR